MPRCVIKVAGELDPIEIEADEIVQEEGDSGRLGETISIKRDGKIVGRFNQIQHWYFEED